tara:strand:- start:2 stop:304 length:303 start_codon:yes stop_codon:yes gene_type:complete
MERFVLIVYSESEFYLFPVSSFVGAKYVSSTSISVYFEKAPFSYKFDFTVDTSKGPKAARAIGELFNMSPENVIEFNNITGKFASDYVTALSTGTKVVIK